MILKMPQSLMSFILPDQFEPVINSLRAIFKVKNEATNMLYRERTMRAKRMMMPFVLRRRKDQVRRRHDEDQLDFLNTHRRC